MEYQWMIDTAVSALVFPLPILAVVLASTAVLRRLM